VSALLRSFTMLMDMTKRMALFGSERSGQAFVEFVRQQLDVFD
jgi:hypothetical protein